ncbi:MAG TPA: molybdenum cofactor guanylyltransferase [Acidimicrobiales bacterium]|nr:molybdenum cofactor guanylyltransferase [Acidimicrobiales bacterium]
MAERWTGAVLTGGRSRRMGRDKALLSVDDVPMARRVAQVLLTAGAADVTCIGGDLHGLRAAGLSAVPDDDPDAGPLGGVLTAIGTLAAAIVVIAPCDLLDPQPALFTTLAGALADRSSAGAAVPSTDGRWRPLPVALRASCRDALDAAYASGERAVHRALAQLDLVIVAVAAGTLADADTPEDLRGRR